MLPSSSPVKDSGFSSSWEVAADAGSNPAGSVMKENKISIEINCSISEIFELFV